jgi:glycosyltransferase involved in cell wall biosynthesis
MRPIKLAVFFDQQLHAGGGYQQALNAAQLARQLPLDVCIPLFVTSVANNVSVLRSYGIEAHYLPIPKWRRVILKLRTLIRWLPAIHFVRRWFGENIVEGYLSHHSIDLVYFTSPSGLALNLERLNYIFILWDLSHRDDPEFPEVRDDREFERRDVLYNGTLTKAVAVLVDSEIGKINVVRRYGVDDERVHVMPFSPASGAQISEVEYESGYIDIKFKYELETDYVFYPAQFWSHKNHVYLLRGLKLLEESYGIRISAVFAGGDAGGNLEYVKKVAQELGLSERVRFAGFVPNEEVPYLYRQAIALVMPTYFGPTNLPPLEAFSLGVPVLYPDRPGLRDQVGDAAFLMDLNDPRSMAVHISSLINNPTLRGEMICKGKAVLVQYSDQHRLNILIKILDDFRQRRDCWI